MSERCLQAVMPGTNTISMWSPEEFNSYIVNFKELGYTLTGHGYASTRVYPCQSCYSSAIHTITKRQVKSFYKASRRRSENCKLTDSGARRARLSVSETDDLRYINHANNTTDLNSTFVDVMMWGWLINL